MSKDALIYSNVRAYGNSVFFIGYKDGKRIQEKLKFQPSLFLPSDQEEKYKSYFGQNLKERKFADIKQMKLFIEQHQDIENFDIFGTSNAAAQVVSKLFPKPINSSISDLRIFQLDIETRSNEGFPEPREAKSQITAISVRDVKTNIIHVWGVKDYKPHLANISYRQFSLDTERELLADFLTFWKSNYPDVITGWHIRGFDIPYLYNRIKLVLGEQAAKSMSPWNVVFPKEVKTQKFATTVEELNYDIWGVSELDYKDLYLKYKQGKQPNYKLGTIAQIELDEDKLDFEGTLDQLFLNDYQKYVEYNVHDVMLVARLEDKLRYLELLIEVAYMGKVPLFTDALGTTKYWETIIYHHLYSKKTIIPLKDYEAAEKDSQFAGAFVKEPIPNKYDWVVSYDLASLYPSIIMQLSIGPETIVKDHDLPTELLDLRSRVSVDALVHDKIDTSILKKYDVSMGANGAFFRRKKSFLSELVSEIFDKRQKYKKLALTNKNKYEETNDIVFLQESIKYDIKQHACKILINAVYGATGSQYFQHYDLKNAEAVTLTGQFVITKTADAFNKYLNTLLKTDNVDYIIAMDTDSAFLNLGTLVKKLFKEETDIHKISNFIDKFCKSKLDPMLKETYSQIFDQLNCFDDKLSMKREKIAPVALWKAKKRYMYDAIDNEGVRYNEVKFGVTGLSVVSSTTPMICKKALEKGMKIILRGTEKELQEHVAEFKKQFFELPPEEIARPSAANDLEKYKNLPSGTPFQIRGAIMYNQLLKKMSLDKIYETVRSKDKIKTLPLKLPNHIKSHVIAFIEKLPKEFDLHKYVDYNEQFDIVFIKPLEELAQIVGWELIKRRKVSEFY